MDNWIVKLKFVTYKIKFLQRRGEQHWAMNSLFSPIIWYYVLCFYVYPPNNPTHMLAEEELYFPIMRCGHISRIYLSIPTIYILSDY